MMAANVACPPTRSYSDEAASSGGVVAPGDVGTSGDDGVCTPPWHHLRARAVAESRNCRRDPAGYDDEVSTSAPPTATPPAGADAPAGRPSGARVLDWALALLAHLCVGFSWVVTTLAVMGSLDVLRRMLMNSEFAFDTGRLPQPWVIPVGLVLAYGSQWFFTWSMRRAGGGTPAWGSRVVVVVAVALGVVVGTYLWTPALQVGAKIGPASGQYAAWGVLGWAAHYARMALPAIALAFAGVLVVFSRHSPLVVMVKALVRRVRSWLAARRTPAASA